MAGSGLEGGWSGWKEWLGFGRGARRKPGVRAAFYAFVLGLVAAIVVPFLPIVQVDDRGEQVPVVFRGLYLEARSLLTGESVEAHTTTAFDANGPAILLTFLLPLLVIAGVIVAFRRSGRSTPLTIGMLVLAVLVLILQMTFFLPSMVAIAFASFQVRRVEMAERAAQQAAGNAQPHDDQATVADDEDDYVDDEYAEDGYVDDEYAEDDVSAEDVDDEYADDGSAEENAVAADDSSDGGYDEVLSDAEDESSTDEDQPESGRRRR